MFLTECISVIELRTLSQLVGLTRTEGISVKVVTHTEVLSVEA
jgi:hypothetical protein